MYQMLEFPEQDEVSIHPNGTIRFPQWLLDQLHWNVPDKIIVRLIVMDYPDHPHDSLVTLLFRRATEQETGYTLGYANRDKKVGGELHCKTLIKEQVNRRADLTLKTVQPLIMTSSKFALGFILNEPLTCVVDFSQAGVKSISTDAVGVYTIVDEKQNTLRVGEGAIANRVARHLADNGELSRNARRVRYFILDKESTAVIEHLLLIRHKLSNDGDLPSGNPIKK